MTRAWWLAAYLDSSGVIQFLTPLWTNYAFAEGVAKAFGEDAWLVRVPG